jgi:hypothetical protein
LQKASVKSLKSGTLKVGDTSVRTERLALHFEGLEVE